MTDQYMTFEQASEFLNTPRSTLYRWLREGRVPAHKLGRQWRFLRHELEAFRTGDSAHSEAAHDELTHLTTLLDQRCQTKGDDMRQAPLAHKLIWDALDRDTTCVHVMPRGGSYVVGYRTNTGIEQLMELEQGEFDALDARLRDVSFEVRQNTHRRYYCERKDPNDDTSLERVQVIYQRLQTLAGRRITLRALRDVSKHSTLEKITTSPNEHDQLESFSLADHGIVLVSGPGGSGKTTTAYSMLARAAKEGGRVIYTLESEAIDMFVPGVNQVEVDLAEPAELRRTMGAIMRSDPDILFIASSPLQTNEELLWQTALSTAEAGHLVIVQLEADSAEDALEAFQRRVARPVDDSMVGVVWQELVREGTSRRARYDIIEGPLLKN